MAMLMVTWSSMSGLYLGLASLGGNLGGVATKSEGMRLAIMQNMQPVHFSSIPILQHAARAL